MRFAFSRRLAFGASSNDDRRRATQGKRRSPFQTPVAAPCSTNARISDRFHFLHKILRDTGFSQASIQVSNN